MDRIEARQDTIESKVTDLASVVARVELNQIHADRVSDLQFKALDGAVKNIDGALERFMGRINGILSGEVRLPQNDALMQEWRDWRDDVNKRLEQSEGKLDEQAVLNGQVRLIGRITVFLVTSNIIAIIAGIAAVLKPT